VLPPKRIPPISRHRSSRAPRQRATGSPDSLRSSAFQQFDLRPELFEALADAGFTEPRPIQLEAIPPALAGRDVLGLAQTGTGKTAAFVLPILERLSKERRPGPRALVVAPTRELASQVHAEFERLGQHTPITSAVVFGGVPIPRQVNALRRRPDVVVACPGRLLDLKNRGALSLDRVEVLVLDEADHMFDMGFLPDLERILAALPKRRQNLLFSATMPAGIRRLAKNILSQPVTVELEHSRPAETIEHGLLCLAEGEKLGLLRHLFAGSDFRSAILFLRTKRRAKKLAEQLGRGGHDAVALQGNMSQGQRNRALQGFREGRFKVLVATDIAARGLDIAGVSHVVNFDLPNTSDAYTHRIGRTGRSGLAGRALTLVTPGDAEALVAIERSLGGPIPRVRPDEFGVRGVEAWPTRSGGSGPSGPSRASGSSEAGRPRRSAASSTGSAQGDGGGRRRRRRRKPNRPGRSERSRRASGREPVRA